MEASETAAERRLAAAALADDGQALTDGERERDPRTAIFGCRPFPIPSRLPRYDATRLLTSRMARDRASGLDDESSCRSTIVRGAECLPRPPAAHPPAADPCAVSDGGISNRTARSGCHSAVRTGIPQVCSTARQRCPGSRATRVYRPRREAPLRAAAACTDARVAEDVVDRPSLDDAAAVHHGDRIDEVPDDTEIMADVNDRTVRCSRRPMITSSRRPASGRRARSSARP